MNPDDAIPPIVWWSPRVMEEMEGYLLAAVVRIVSTGKSMNERTMTDPVSVLTEARVPVVASVCAYLSHVLGDVSKKTKIDVWDVIAGLNPEDAAKWMDRNPELVAEAAETLKGLLGFKCYDG